MSNFLNQLEQRITHYYVDDILFSQHPLYEHLSPHGTTFFRVEDTPIPFTSLHSPNDSAWAYPRGCYSPVERLKHRIATAAQPQAWPEPPLAGEENTTSRRTHDVVTPPIDLWSEDEDGKPCYMGPDLFYRAGLPMGSHLSPGRVQLLHTTPPHSTPHTTSPPTACNPGV